MNVINCQDQQKNFIQIFSRCFSISILWSVSVFASSLLSNENGDVDTSIRSEKRDQDSWDPFTILIFLFLLPLYLSNFAFFIYF